MRILLGVAHEAIAPGELVPGSHAAPRYDDLTYRDKFWRERRYEDLADRIALRSLLPAQGHRLLDRIPWLSGRVPPARLGVLERPLQRLLAAFTRGPSLWYVARKRAVVVEDFRPPDQNRPQLMGADT